MDTRKYFVYNLMHDSYLWSEDTNNLTSFEIDKIENDKKILEVLKYDKDRFSYILSKEEYNDFFQAGINSGYGFFPSLIEDENGTLFINIDFVYPNTPATEVGLKRGDLIRSIDNISITDLYNENLLNKKVYESSSMNIVLVDKSQKTITKESYNLSTVLHRSIIEQDGKKIGYLVFQSFISISYKELNDSFSYFKLQNIDDLILDLRYNGGCYIDVSNYLSSLIAGKKVEGKVFNREKYNDKYSSFDSIDYFIFSSCLFGYSFFIN
jgi:C-terminal processing protease CtpA/Prc